MLNSYLEYQNRVENRTPYSLLGLFFETEEDFFDYNNDPDMGVASDMPTLCAAITYSTDEQGQHRFRLHYPDNTSIRQQLIPYQSYYAFDKYNSNVRKQREAYHLYSRCSYSFLQNWIANAVLRNETGIWDASIASLTLPMKLDNLREDGGFIEFQEHLFPLCILLMFLIPILRLVYTLVTEERKGEKLMFKQQLGMSELQYMLSLLIAYLLVTSVISVIFMLITKYEVLLNSNAFLIFAFYELYALALFGFAVLLSYIFILMGISSSVSQLLLVLCYFSSFFCDYTVNSPYFVSETRRILGCFFPSVAMKRAIFNIIVFEKSGIGLQYSNFKEVYYNFRVENSFYMFAATFAFGTSLGLLLNSFRNIKVLERIAKYLKLRGNKSKIGVLTPPISESPSNNSTQRLNLLSSQRDGLILNATNQVAAEGLDQNMNFPVGNANIKGEQCNNQQRPQEEVEYNTQGFLGLQGEERSQESNMALGGKKRVQKRSRNEASKEDKTGVGLGKSPTAHGQRVLSDRNNGLKSQEVIRFDTQTARKHQKDEETNRIQQESVSIKRVAFDTEEKQPDDGYVRANLKISNLSKTFPGSESPAINNLNLNLYTGEIFAILGHNGAGKSTAIDMISGILQANSGSITFDGIELVKDSSKVKENIAICSASDQLIENLTVYEHLEIYSRALGADIEDIEKIRASLLTEINNFSSQISDLSVGQRRLLQVALLFLGDKRVILLDDPYYGLDRNAKKRLWDFLLKNKSDRIILLTTLGDKNPLKLSLTTIDLEETQQFADRAAILHGGELIQVGPPQTILSNFEYGYTLTVTLKNTEQKFLKFLEQQIGQSNYCCSSPSGQVLEILIKKEFQREIIKMLQCLDDQSEELGIECYQIGTSTLSEVVKVIDRESKTLNNVKKEVMVNDDAKNYTSQVKLNPDISEDLSTKDVKTATGMRILFIRVAGLLSLRTINARQKWRRFLVETLMPPLIIAIGFVFQSIKFDFTSPSRTLSTDLFSFQQQQKLLVNSELIKSDNNNGTNSTDFLAENFFNDNFNSSYFNLVPINLTQQNNSSNYTAEKSILDYMEEIIGYQNDISEQHLYGSYILYEANNVSKQFKFATFLNLTAQESTVLYPQMMYESIVKEATGSPSLKFTLTTVPLQVGLNKQSDEASLIQSYFNVFVIAIGFSLIPAFITSQDFYNNNMLYTKDQGPSTFLLVNLFFDICKAMIPSAITIGILAAFNLSIEAWRVFLIFPFAIVPFTYSLKLLPFQKACVTAFTIFLHIAVSGIGVIMVTLFRMEQETLTLGDTLVWAFKIIPSFCLTNPIMYSSSKDRLFALRPELDKGDLDMSLIGGDMAVLAGHFGFWIIILILTEKMRSIRHQRINEDQQQEITNNSSNLIQLRSIRLFSDKDAEVQVDDKTPIIDLTVKEGDSIAIFGNNGSGKSTLVQSIGKQLKPKFGTIQSKQGLTIGFCPENQERIKEQMTVQQCMNIKGKLSGIPLEVRMKEIGNLINIFQFEKLKDEKLASLPSHEYRKLQIALTLIGEPVLILLDEPTFGITQDQQDIVWNALQKWKADHKKSALVIATSQPTVMQQFKPVTIGALSKSGFQTYNMPELQKSGFSGYHVQVQFRVGTKNEIQTMKEVFGKESSELRVSDMEKLMQSNGVSEFLISELQKGTQFDLWKDVLKEASGGTSGLEWGFVTADTFFNTLHMLKNLCLLISHLAKYFINGIEIIDIHGPNVIFSIENDQGSSVGQIFDLISELNSMLPIINSFDVRETSHLTLAIKASLGKDVVCKRGDRIFMRKGQIMRIQDYNEPSSVASNTHQKLEESKLQQKSYQLEGSFKPVNQKFSARQQSFSPMKADNRPFSDCTDAPVSLGPSGVPDGESVMSKEKMEMLNGSGIRENYIIKQAKELPMTVIQSPKQENVSFLPPIQLNNRLQSQNQLQFFIDY